MEHLLKTLPPVGADPFPHLADLSVDQMVGRRVEISETLKHLEQEKQFIDAELLEIFSDAELRFGVRAPGGWMLKSRSRTSWDYAAEIRDAIKGLQQQAQRQGQAKPMVSTYLCLTQESA
ncbi:hypothetical protein [Cyanobium sp. ATX 6F1]|uniref:hypothetical protein n=1 Tax=unclassified Cyanobium TaxID=2627006 RepID=UPI0020CE7DFD|nr:hypothetical protein [Cyanobium sp. ATX 6F1]MCP9916931.1 hypothetical protein [Cyanobium sp. ATX 6F1]